MNQRVVVTLGGYGNFDLPKSESVWLAPKGMSKMFIEKIVEQIEASTYNNKDPFIAIKRLKKEGFTELKNIECLIGGGY